MKAQKTIQASSKAVSADIQRKPFIEHVHELRRRALVCSLAVAAFSGIGYAIHRYLLDLIQAPLGKTLYYTSPAGGFSFVFKLCVLFGIVCALPVIIYNILKFIGPVFGRLGRRTLAFYLMWSIILAAAGIAFAYFVSLPAALHFLANFGGESIQSLITAEAYFNFALAYLIGFAVLFQLPLLMAAVNRVTPLRPAKMMRGQRYIIVGSFIVAAILTPTPDPLNQALMALPVILLYQVSIILIWAINSRRARLARSTLRFQPVTQSYDAAEPIESFMPPVAVTSTAPRLPTPLNRQPRTISDFVARPVPKAASSTVKSCAPNYANRRSLVMDTVLRTS